MEDDNVPAIYYSYNADWVLALLQSQGILGRWDTYEAAEQAMCRIVRVPVEAVPGAVANQSGK